MKIFLLLTNQYESGDAAGVALTENGRVLDSHYSSNRIWLRRDLTNPVKRRGYAEAVGDYTIVDLLDKTDDELEAMPEVSRAISIANELYHKDKPDVPEA